MKFKKYIDEAAYMGNLGFSEMVKFYQEADNKQIDQLEKILKKNDWTAFKKLIKKVLGVELI